jgi:hypothetical protein
LSKKQVNLSGNEIEISHPRRMLKDPEPAKTMVDRSRELLRLAQNKRKKGQTEKDIETF